MIHWRRDKLPTPVFMGFLYGSAGKESACNVGDLGSIPGFDRSYMISMTIVYLEIFEEATRENLFLDHHRLIRQVVQRLLAVSRA